MRPIDADALEKGIRFYAKTLHQNIKHSRTKDFQPSRDFARGVEDGYCRILSALKAQPTIDPVKWIPVTEGLPKNDDWVIVTILDESGDTPFRYTDFGWYLDVAHRWIVEAGQRTDVIAWMPLPKPWKGESDA